MQSFVIVDTICFKSEIWKYIFYYTTLYSISHFSKFSYNISGVWCMRSESGVWNPEHGVWILEISIHHAPDFQQ